MLCKAKLFGDLEGFNKILNERDPKQMKKLGRQVKNFDKSVYIENILSIVAEICFQKFKKVPGLKQLLLETGEKVIAEAAPRDRLWGIGMGKSNEVASRPWVWVEKGRLNLLGYGLMLARLRLS
mmetsp:Transcript_12562/g.21148  ORF Transcript_12562/g.21148 Transcript_12562/m.21148 type:complete len:124 (-) Transcript_12562:51-422(-)